MKIVRIAGDCPIHPLSLIGENQKGHTPYDVAFLIPTGVWREFVNLPNPAFYPKIHTGKHR
jgi:hypothetical protein